MEKRRDVKAKAKSAIETADPPVILKVIIVVNLTLALVDAIQGQNTTFACS